MALYDLRCHRLPFSISASWHEVGACLQQVASACVEPFCAARTHLAERRANEREAQEVALRAWGDFPKLRGEDWRRVFEPYFSELDAIERHLQLVRDGAFDDPVTGAGPSDREPGPVVSATPG